MDVISSVRPLLPDSAVCLGAFDGLHVGHQALLALARALADRVALLTFDPHPARLLAPQHAPPLLQTPTQRVRVCEQLGVDQLVVLPFDRTMAARSPVQFVDEVLAPLAAARVIVGEDFRFGRGRDGSAASLATLAGQHSIRVDVLGTVTIGTDRADDAPAEKISSSSIRDHVAEGDLVAAERQLGRWYSIEGTVQHGAGRGRGLGFPTANVVCQDALLPPEGVYAAAMAVLDFNGTNLASPIYPAVVNLGPAPTFAEATTGADLEVHALGVDFGDSLYDARVEVWLAEHLREPRRFGTIDALRQAITEDIHTATALLGSDLDTRARAHLPAAPRLP